jgi:hypothetical protein
MYHVQFVDILGVARGNEARLLILSLQLARPTYTCVYLCARLLHFQANTTSVHYPPRSRFEVLFYKYMTLTI